LVFWRLASTFAKASEDRALLLSRRSTRDMLLYVELHIKELMLTGVLCGVEFLEAVFATV